MRATFFVLLPIKTAYRHRQNNTTSRPLAETAHPKCEIPGVSRKIVHSPVYGTLKSCRTSPVPPPIRGWRSVQRSPFGRERGRREQHICSSAVTYEDLSAKLRIAARSSITMTKAPLRFQKSRTAWHTMSRLERTHETCGAEAPRKEQERETTKSENKRDSPSKSSRVENGRLSGSRRVSPTVPNPPSTQVGAVTSRAPSDGECGNATHERSRH